MNVRKIINREKPLALYVFSNNSQVFEDFKHQTSSGSVVLNETLMHLTRKNQQKKTILFFLLIILQYLVECLPFGGVGNSGIGNYHGN